MSRRLTLLRQTGHLLGARRFALASGVIVILLATTHVPIAMSAEKNDVLSRKPGATKAKNPPVVVNPLSVFSRANVQSMVSRDVDEQPDESPTGDSSGGNSPSRRDRARDSSSGGGGNRSSGSGDSQREIRQQLGTIDVPFLRTLGRKLSRLPHGLRMIDWLDAGYSEDARACSQAVRRLGKFACGEDAHCDYEEKFAQRCEEARPAIANRCISIEQEYVDRCLIGRYCDDLAFPKLTRYLRPAALVSRSGHVGCSSVIFRDTTLDAEQAVLATAKHCLSDVQDDAYAGDDLPIDPDVVAGMSVFLMRSDLRVDPFVPDLSKLELLTGDEAFNDEVAYFRLETAQTTKLALDVLSVGYPTLYAKTHLFAFNRFSYIRDGLEDEASGYMACDSSDICTVSRAGDGWLEHYCQTSRGSSGGALFQVDARNRPVLVGINEHGTIDDGVTKNVGRTLLAEPR